MTDRELLMFIILFGAVGLFAIAGFVLAWLGKAEGKEP